MRSRVIACSSTTEISRFHITCMRISLDLAHAALPLRTSRMAPSLCMTASKGEVTTVEVSRSTITAGPLTTLVAGRERVALDDRRQSCIVSVAGSNTARVTVGRTVRCAVAEPVPRGRRRARRSPSPTR